MKKILTVLSTTLILFAGQASADFYIQPQVGYSKMNSSTFTGSSSTYYGLASGDLEHENGLIYGAELGISNFEKHNVLRLGVSWLALSGEIDSAHVNVTGGDLLVAGSYSLTASEAQDAGLDFSNDMNLFSASLYYDFPVESAFRPYIGVGLGIADIDHADDQETATRVMVGGNYEIASDIQLGLKYDYIKVNKITDNTGAEFNHGKLHALSVTLNFQF